MYLIILNPYRIYSSILGLSCLPIHLASYSTHISVYLTLHLSIRQYLCLSYHLYISLSLFDSSSSRVYGPVSCCAYEYFCEYCRNFCSDCQITFGLVQLSVLIGTIVGVDWYDCRCWMVRLSVLIGTVVGVDWYGCRCWLVRLSVLIGTVVGVDYYGCRCWLLRLSVLIGTVVGVDWYDCRCWLVLLWVLIQFTGHFRIRFSIV